MCAFRHGLAVEFVHLIHVQPLLVSTVVHVRCQNFPRQLQLDHSERFSCINCVFTACAKEIGQQLLKSCRQRQSYLVH